MNWQIVVGLLFLLYGIVGVFTDFLDALIALLIAFGLLYWGAKKKGLLPSRKATAEAPGQNIVLNKSSNSTKEKKIDQADVNISNEQSPGTASGTRVYVKEESDLDTVWEEIHNSIKQKEIERTNVIKSNDLTPSTVSDKKRRYHYKDVNIWVKWQYSGQYGKTCESIGIRRGDPLDLLPPQDANDDPDAVALFWNGTEIGFMKTNRMRSMVHQWQKAKLPVLAVVSSVGGENKILIEFAFYGAPKS